MGHNAKLFALPVAEDVNVRGAIVVAVAEEWGSKYKNCVKLVIFWYSNYNRNQVSLSNKILLPRFSILHILWQLCFTRSESPVAHLMYEKRPLEGPFPNWFQELSHILFLIASLSVAEIRDP